MKSEVIVPFEDQNYFMHSQHLDENLFQILGNFWKIKNKKKT